MKRGFRLAGVLRARQAQEDAARGEVLRARHRAAEAAQVADGHDRSLAAHQMPDEDSARAVVAALTARLATTDAQRSAAREVGS